MLNSDYSHHFPESSMPRKPQFINNFCDTTKKMEICREKQDFEMNKGRVGWNRGRLGSGSGLKMEHLKYRVVSPASKMVGKKVVDSIRRYQQQRLIDPPLHSVLESYHAQTGHNSTKMYTPLRTNDYSSNCHVLKQPTKKQSIKCPKTIYFDKTDSMQITFSADSTEPELSDLVVQSKHFEFSEYGLPARREEKERKKEERSRVKGQFERKLRERELASKQKVYRQYIRFTSRQKNMSKKKELKEQMGTLLTEIYHLRKQSGR